MGHSLLLETPGPWLLIWVRAGVAPSRDCPARELLGLLEDGGLLFLVLELVDDELAVLHDLDVVDPVRVVAAGGGGGRAGDRSRAGEDAHVRAERDLHVRVVALVVLTGLEPVGAPLAAPADVRERVRVRVLELPEPLPQEL